MASGPNPKTDRSSLVEADRYRRLFEANPQPMWVYDLETLRFLEVNGAALRHYGYSRPEFLAMTIADIRPEEDIPLLEANLASARETLEHSGVWRHRRKDGSIIEVEIVSHVFEHQGVPARMVAVNDVTATQQANRRLGALLELQTRRLGYEQALSECSRALLAGSGGDAMEQALGALLEATGATAVFVERNVTDPELGPSTRRVHRLTAGQGGTGDGWGVVPWTDLPTEFSHLSRGEPFTFLVSELSDREQELYRGSGTLSGLVLPIMTGGRWLGLVGFSEGRTERTWDEEEKLLLRTAAEMIGAFWERAEAEARLEELVRAKDEFVASVSHELRTPLTGVLGFARALRDRGQDLAHTEREELLDLVVAQAEEVSHIVEDLLVAARSQIGEVVVSAERVDLAAELGATMTAVPIPDDRRVETGGNAEALADAARVRQILRNLVSNAIRYGGPTMRVTLGEEGERVFVEVADDGPDVAEHDLEQVFRPYHRAEGRPNQPGSIGLGLHVSRNLARLMGGDLTADRSEGWTVFRLTLPAA